MAIKMMDEFTLQVRVVGTEDSRGRFGVTPVFDPSVHWWCNREVLENSPLVFREGEGPVPAEKGNTYGDDELVAMLLKRLSVHASAGPGLIRMDYGRIEELCWLIRWVMSDGALPAS